MVSLYEALGSSSVGAVDVVMEKLDADKGRTEPLKRWADYGRIGACIGSIASQYVIRGGTIPRILDGVFYGSLPLVMKTARDYALKKPAAGGGAAAAVAPSVSLERVTAKPRAPEKPVTKPKVEIAAAPSPPREKGISF